MQLYKLFIFYVYFARFISPHLAVLRGRAMYAVLLHPFVRVDMLRPETMVFPEYHAHTQ